MPFANHAPNLCLDALDTMYPCRLFCLEASARKLDTPGSHYFGFVLEGEATLTSAGRPASTLSEKMYFSCPNNAEVAAKGKVVIWEKLGYRGLYQVGGPTEPEGRLTYIDHCSTTLLVPPARALDPVLNLLHFVPDVKQTMHLHPTVRLGVVFQGSGACVSPGKPNVTLERGAVFLLQERAPHCFHSGKQGMTLIAFHPESDTGPTDQSHPMLNRTYTTP